jgi:FAD/FMN-containing dehydrogenase
MAFKKITISFLLITAIASQAAINPFKWFDDRLTISDISQTSIIPIKALYKPKTIQELQYIVRSTSTPIAIAAGRYSQGGQIAYPNGTVIDITGLHAIKHFDSSVKEITVEAGITWRSIQKFIDFHKLSIKVMQSYNDFTVGGSLSVNVHGRDIHHGSLIETVKSIKVMLADGSIVMASRTQNPDLFAGAIGGYGALGIIIEATFSLTDNYIIEQMVKQMPIEEYPQFFLQHIKNNPKAIFHNANLYPNDFKIASSVTWYKTDKPLIISAALRKRKKFYPLQALAEQILRRLPFLHDFRPFVDAKKGAKPSIVTRNYEMSSTVNTLEPVLRFPTTTVLQEYFIPIDNLLSFIQQVRAIAQLSDINIMNISIRYIPENNESMLSYSQTERFSFVFYINILNTEEGLESAQIWTRKLIDAALTLNGSYYLPYQLFGTQAQVEKSYPRFNEFLQVKKKYDPNSRFSNCLIKKYGLIS